MGRAAGSGGAVIVSPLVVLYLPAAAAVQCSADRGVVPGAAMFGLAFNV